MGRQRLLIPITIQFGVRYLLRTGLLKRLGDYSEPVVLLAWDDEELRRDLELAGAEVWALPKTHFGASYQRIRRQVDAWYAARLKSPSSGIDRRRADLDRPLSVRLLRAIRDASVAAKLMVPGAAVGLLKAERDASRRDTNLQEFESLLDRLRLDAVFTLTPFHRQEELALRAAQARGLPSCAAIHSFDNLTTRGWMPVIFDRYLLWNRYNESELRRGYPEAAASKTVIVGPPQFDFYWNRDYLWSEDDWRRKLSLPDGRQVILFGAGLASIVPHEPHFLGQIDEAVERNEIPGRPLILFRCHPMDSRDRWFPVLNQAKNVICDDPWPSGSVPKYTNIRDEDIARLASTLRHSQVHVNVSSTMTLDGAVFDRPQIGPAYDDRPGRRYDRVCRELYQREHYLPITKSGGLAVARSRDEMVAAIRDALLDPEAKTVGRKKMLREVCTFTDGMSTDRVVAEMRKFLSATGSKKDDPKEHFDGHRAPSTFEAELTIP